jgi:hypothetical protein
VVEVDGQLFLGPVGPVQATAGRALANPPQDLGGQGRWALRRSPRSPADLEAGEPPLVITLQPTLQGRHTDGQILGKVAMGPSASGQEDGLTADAQTRIGGGFPACDQWLVFLSTQSDLHHRRLLPGAMAERSTASTGQSYLRLE